MASLQLSEVLKEEDTSCFCFECKPAISQKITETLHELLDGLGVITLRDGFYEKLRTIEYLKLFARLHRHQSLVKEALEHMQLQDLAYVKITKLNASQRMRLAIAREIIKDQPYLFIEEPLSSLDDASTTIVLNWLDLAPNFHKQLFLTSHSLKDVCLLPGEHYTIDHELQLHKLENMVGQDEPIEPMLKISARLKDKVLLFHPNEIDYIESLEGKSYLHVRASNFQCSQTLEDLEQQLRRFGFYRSHRSYLVNMQKVVEIVRWTRNSYSLKLEGLEDERIPLSKGRVDEMKELYNF